MMEQKPVFPFGSVGHALAYYNKSNPARQKHVNFYEPERFHKPQEDDFTGGSPRDVWSSIAIGMGRVMRYSTHEEYWAFTWRFIGDRTEQKSCEDIAKELGCSVGRVYRMLRKIEERLEREFVRRELIEPQQERSLENRK